MSAPPAGGMSRSIYVNAFVGTREPKDSLGAIQNRLRKAKVLNEEVALYFSARRELEEAYLKALGKISKRSFLQDPSCMPVGFAPVYERLVAEVGEVAKVHGELERKIGIECEDVLRESSNRGAFAQLRDVSQTLHAL